MPDISKAEVQDYISGDKVVVVTAAGTLKVIPYNLLENYINDGATRLQELDASLAEKESQGNVKLSDLTAALQVIQTESVERAARYTAINYTGDFVASTAYEANDVWKNTADGSLWIVPADYTSGATAQADIDAKAVRPHQDRDRVEQVTSLEELKLVVPAYEGQLFYLSEGGRHGTFKYLVGDYSAEVADDVDEIEYIALDNDPTGVSGCLVSFEDVNTVDRTTGTYLPVLSKMRGGSEFEFSRALSRNAYRSLLAGGDETDYSDLINEVSEDSSNLVLPPAVVYVGGKLDILGPKNLKGHFGKTILRTLDSFVGDKVINAQGTRQTVRDLMIDVTNSVYDPNTDVTADRVTGIYTGGLFYHCHIDTVTVFGGYRAFRLGALEARLKNSHSVNSRNSLWVDGADANVENFSATDPVHTGVYSDAGLEGKNIHIVRAGSVALSLLNQSPVSLNQVFIDTPRKTGIRLAQTNGAQIEQVYFSKFGQGAAPSDDVYYFELNNSRNNRFTGGNIFAGNETDGVTPIPQTNKFFMKFGDTGGDDSVASINNEFVGFNLPSGLDVAENNTQRGNALRQMFKNCGGIARRYNNDGKLYRSSGEYIASSGAKSYKVFLRNRPSGTAFSSVFVRGEYVFRKSASERQTGKFIITLPTSDFSTGGGSFISELQNGSETFAGLTVSNVAYDDANLVLTFDVNNALGSDVLFAFTLDNLLDDHGAF